MIGLVTDTLTGSRLPITRRNYSAYLGLPNKLLDLQGPTAATLDAPLFNDVGAFE